MTKELHHGWNLRRIRSLLDLTQEQMAAGLDIVQQEYSKIEHKEIIDDTLLNRIGKLINVHPSLIKNLEEQLIQNVHQYDGNKGVGFDCRKTDVELYERLLAEKDENLRLKEELLKSKSDYILLLQQNLNK